MWFVEEKEQGWVEFYFVLSIVSLRTLWLLLGSELMKESKN